MNVDGDRLARAIMTAARAVERAPFHVDMPHLAALEGQEQRQLDQLMMMHPDFDIDRTMRIARSSVLRNSEVLREGFCAYLKGEYEAWAKRMGDA